MVENKNEESPHQEIAYTVAQLKGRRLRMMRALTGFSRQEIYDQLGIATSTMDTWESGRIELTEKSADRVSKSFKKIGIYCSPEWLLTGNGLPPRMMSDVERSMLSDKARKDEDSDNEDKCSPDIPTFLDENIRRELNFFLNLHKGAIFHVMEGNFLNSRFKKGDCVAGIPGKTRLLEGKIILAVTDDKRTLPCRLIKSDVNTCRVSFGSNKAVEDLHIIKAAEIIWHRIVS